MKKIFTILSVVALTAVNAQNLVQNPSFEDWADGDAKPNAWFGTNSEFNKITDVTNIKSGVYSLGVISKEKGSVSIGATDINVEAGKTYVYSGWYLDRTDKASIRFWGQWRNDSVITDTSLQSDYLNGESEGVWKQFYIEATAPSGAVKARLSLRVYSQSAGFGGMVYFDDISFIDKSNLSVTDAKTLENTVKFNTVVDDVLRVQTSERVTLNVYSAEGKLVSSNRVSNNDTVNMQGLVKGVYIVVVDNGGAKFSKKVVKK